ncbi:hypothetical protein EJ02DRAFT_339536 [Clathrospora elynae]|uniref:Small secreted protein n=1 Tax=Clathrospora elynae TaxID=706981 RepID=A0A6A5T2U4_9PLEO|nr:hypothetical protein EJ02DRAFT_339536 [Clathrospora elynae]
MHFLTPFLAAAVSLLSTASAGQANFFSDTNCRHYLGTTYPSSLDLPSGGPAGSFSAMWIEGDQTECRDTCGPYVICGDPNCAAHYLTALGSCVGTATGVWVANRCGCW